MYVLKENMRDKHKKDSKYDDSDHLTLDKTVNDAEDWSNIYLWKCPFKTQKVLILYEHMQKRNTEYYIGWFANLQALLIYFKDTEDKGYTYKCGYCD